MLTSCSDRDPNHERNLCRPNCERTYAEILTSHGVQWPQQIPDAMPPSIYRVCVMCGGHVTLRMIRNMNCLTNSI